MDKLFIFDILNYKKIILPPSKGFSGRNQVKYLLWSYWCKAVTLGIKKQYLWDSEWHETYKHVFEIKSLKAETCRNSSRNDVRPNIVPYKEYLKELWQHEKDVFVIFVIRWRKIESILQ